jgi:hypothetical protein
VDLDEPVNGTAVAANGVLYVPTMKHLYAVRRGDGALNAEAAGR